MSSATQATPTRTVVLLKPAERKRLEKLASAEKVSSGEILRRSLRAYEHKQEQPTGAEEEVAAILLAQMNEALDAALVSLRSANATIQANLRKIDDMQQEQARWRAEHKQQELQVA